MATDWRSEVVVITLLSKVARKFRGENINLDRNIPAAYLIGFVFEKLFARARGLVLLRRLTPTAFVGRHARIRCAGKIRLLGYANFGMGSYVDALSREGLVLGHGFSLGRQASIECTGTLQSLGKGLTTGDNVGIGSFSFLGCAGGIIIGADTILGNYVSMHAENHNYAELGVPVRLQGVNHKGIVIGRNCWIGAKATILDGVEIGDDCIVAAGAVVREGQYVAGSLLAGVPAKVVKALR